ncbi:hypothetical protein [Aerococcus christensenii]|uniref:hypothetical protein n=1 Tax=Aerococcus christensenii TaxID=87541 RepID=UPI003F6E3F7F
MKLGLEVEELTLSVEPVSQQNKKYKFYTLGYMDHYNTAPSNPSIDTLFGQNVISGTVTDDDIGKYTATVIVDFSASGAQSIKCLYRCMYTLDLRRLIQENLKNK